MSQEQLVYISGGRLSFPHLAEPQRKKQDDGTEKISYNAEFIIPETNPAWAKFFEVMNKMALEKWQQHAAQILQLAQADRKKRCYGWGQEKINGKTFQPYDGYAGNVFITAGRDTMPQIIRADGSAVPAEAMLEAQALARKMYGGCRVNAVVKPWLQDNKHGKGVRADLVAVQFLADDTPFGEGNIDASGLFGQTPAATSGAPSLPGAPPAMPGATPPWMNQAAAPQMPPAPFPQGGAVPGQPQWAPPSALPSFLQR